MNDKTVILRRSATIVRSEPAGSRREILAAPYMRKWALLEEANRQADRGEIRIEGPCVWVRERSEWHVPILRLRDPAPAWRKPALIVAAVLAPVLTLSGLGWWALATLAAIPGGLLLAGILACFIGWCIVHFKSRGGSVTVINQVVTKVRVR